MHLECNDEIMIMMLHSTQYAIDRSGGVLEANAPKMHALVIWLSDGYSRRMWALYHIDVLPRHIVILSSLKE